MKSVLTDFENTLMVPMVVSPSVALSPVAQSPQQCVVCMSADSDYLVVPCGHQCGCQVCFTVSLFFYSYYSKIYVCCFLSRFVLIRLWRHMVLVLFVVLPLHAWLESIPVELQKTNPRLLQLWYFIEMCQICIYIQGYPPLMYIFEYTRLVQLFLVLMIYLLFNTLFCLFSGSFIS